MKNENKSVCFMRIKKKSDAMDMYRCYEFRLLYFDG